MHPSTFYILYNNQSLPVKEQWKEDRILFTVEIAGETHVFFVSESGSWHASPVLPFEMTQDIGRLIERATG